MFINNGGLSCVVFQKDRKRIAWNGVESSVFAKCQ